jgi:hypothetical protein
MCIYIYINKHTHTPALFRPFLCCLLCGLGIYIFVLILLCGLGFRRCSGETEDAFSRATSPVVSRFVKLSVYTFVGGLVGGRVGGCVRNIV